MTGSPNGSLKDKTVLVVGHPGRGHHQRPRRHIPVLRIGSRSSAMLACLTGCPGRLGRAAGSDRLLTAIDVPQYELAACYLINPAALRLAADSRPE